MYLFCYDENYLLSLFSIGQLKRKTLGVNRQRNRRTTERKPTPTDNPSMVSDGREDIASSPPEKRRRKLTRGSTCVADGESGCVVTECEGGGERVGDAGGAKITACVSGERMEYGEKRESGGMEYREKGEGGKMDYGEKREGGGMEYREGEKMEYGERRDSGVMEYVEKTEGAVGMECRRDEGIMKSVCIGEDVEDLGTSISQKDARDTSSHKHSELGAVEDVTTISTSSNAKRLKVNTREPVGTGSKSERRSKLKLSLSSKKRHPRRNLLTSNSSSSSAASSPALPSYPLTCDNVNTHPLTVQWKTRALRNPPRVRVSKITHFKTGEGPTVSVDASEASFTTSPPSTPSTSGVLRSRRSKRTKPRTKLFCTRSKKTLLMTEKEALEWAISESLRESSNRSEESFSTQSSSESLLAFSQDEAGRESSSSLLAGTTDPEHSGEDILPSVCGGADREDVEVSPSDMSSQGIDSDFHLVVTESDSESSEAILPSHSVKRRKEVGPCDGSGTEEQSPFNSDMEQKLSSTCASASPLQIEISSPERKIRPLRRPPSAQRLIETATTYGLPSALHKQPFYSNPSDVQPPRFAFTFNIIAILVFSFSERRIASLLGYLLRWYVCLDCDLSV